MKRMNVEKFWKMLNAHRVWLNNEGEGERAVIHDTAMHNVGAHKDFRGMSLVGCSFRGLSMRYADFRNADLRGVNFYGAHLVGADFRGADLRGANLEYVALNDADFRGANLEGAIIKPCYAHGAKFD